MIFHLFSLVSTINNFTRYLWPKLTQQRALWKGCLLSQCANEIRVANKKLCKFNTEKQMKSTYGSQMCCGKNRSAQFTNRKIRFLNVPASRKKEALSWQISNSTRIFNTLVYLLLFIYSDLSQHRHVNFCALTSKLF